LELLLDAGVDELGKCIIDDAEDGGWTLALRACYLDNYDALAMIIDRGANLETQLAITGQTALSICAEYGRETCARLLIDSGANVDSADAKGDTPLLLATLKGHRNIVALLVNRAHADVNARNIHQGTALMLASEYGDLHCVRLLLAVNGIAIDAMDDDGDTALSCAASWGHANIVLLLIEHKADVNAAGRLGPTARQGKASFANITSVSI
jgi:ankyrin repeat protein